MLILIFFAYLVTNISVIKCTDNFEKIHVTIDNNETCVVEKNYTFPTDSSVVVELENKSHRKVNLASIHQYSDDQTENGNFSFKFTKKSPYGFAYIPSSNITYELFFKFSYEHAFHMDHSRIQQDVRPMCNTKVLFDSAPNEMVPLEKCIHFLEPWHTYTAIGGVLAGIIIIALAATIMYYKRRADLLSKRINLERRTERTDEHDRYCSNPRKGKKVAPIINKNRDSDIYEDPQITLGVSSIPPALPTSPRPNRSNCSTLRIPSSSSMTLKSNASSHPTFPRSKATDKEAQTKMSIAQRPPLPLPQEEFYAESQEEETYEEPPIPERTPQPTRKHVLPCRIGAIPEKNTKPAVVNKSRPEVISRPRPEKISKTFGEKLGKTLPNIPMDGLKPPGMNQLHKPAVPKGKPTPPRNNVVQVPIRQIPDASSLKKVPLVKPKPNARPHTPPPPTLEQEDFFHDDRRDSTDDEYWTYEPLPQYNIYNN